MFEENQKTAETLGKQVGLGFALLIFASILYYISGKFGWFLTKISYMFFILIVLAVYVLFVVMRR